MDEHEARLDRRQVLECMVWAGTGIVWTLNGGVPASRLIGAAKAEETGFSFVQISDSHVGFAKPANPDARATLREGIARIKALPVKPAFMLHTGDVAHLAKPQGVRRRGAIDRRSRAGDALRRPASTTSSIRPRATPISRASARARRAGAGTPSTTTACISSRSSMSSTSARTGWGRSGRTSSPGWTTTSRAARPRRLSSYSRTSRFG